MNTLNFPSSSTSNFINRILKISDETPGSLYLKISYSEVGNNRINDLAQEVRAVSQEMLQHVRLEAQSLDHLNAIDLSKLGYTLSTVAFPQSIHKVFAKDLTQSETSDRRLRIHIDDRDSVVSGWPWEFLWLNTVGFLSINPNCSIVRASEIHPETPKHWLVSGNDRLSLLIVWADPGEPYGQLDARPQIDTITKLTQDLALKDLNIEILLPHRYAESKTQIASLSNLQNHLEKQPAHIIYFLTHGDFDSEQQQGLIVLERNSESERYQRILATDLETLFSNVNSPFVIIFDGCRSASRGPEGTGKSLAEAVAKYGHTVIGMQYNWPAAACHPFWREFFRMFSVPRPLDECMFSSRDFLYRLCNSLPQLDTDQFPSVIDEHATFTVGDWGFPVMYRTHWPLKDIDLTKPKTSSEDRKVSELQQLTNIIGDDVMERLMKLDQTEIKSITEMMHRATNMAYKTKLLVEREDSLRVLLAGPGEYQDQQLINTSPTWFTQLLKAPNKISWDSYIVAQVFKIRIWTVDEGDLLVTSTNTPYLEITPNQKKQLPVDQFIRWEVQNDKMHTTLVRGVFRILPQTNSKVIIQTLNTLNDDSFNIKNDMYFVDCCIRWALYDELLHRFSDNSYPTAVIAYEFIRPRIQAHIYAAMHDELNRRQLTSPEGLWAATKANEYVNEFYRLLV